MKCLKIENMSYTADGCIDCLITGMSGEVYPYTVSPDDIEDKELFDMMKAGVLGVVVPYTPPVVTETEKIAIINQAVTEMLDKEAAKRGYANIQSAALRAGYQGPFHLEGVAYAVWMDACWEFCYSSLAKIRAGNMLEPTLEEFLAMMPELNLPS